MTNEIERLQIREMIEKGVISASEGVRLLNSLQDEPGEDSRPLLNPTATTTAEAPAAPEAAGEPLASEAEITSAPYDFNSGIKRWRRWWWLPLTVGIGITVTSGFLMFLAYQKSGFG